MSLAFLIIFGAVVLDLLNCQRVAFIITVLTLLVVSVTTLLGYMTFPLGGP